MKLWWSVVGSMPLQETQKLLVSILEEREQLIFKCMFKILGCLGGSAANW